MNGKLLINQIQLSMEDIRRLVHGLESSTRTLLVRRILLLDGDDQLPALDLKQLCDHPSQMKEGWSFLSDQRTSWSVDGSTWMMRRQVTEPQLRERFRTSTAKHAPVDELKFSRWLEDVKAFKEQLFALVHLSGGAPARGTEVVSIRHENGRTEPRGIFIESGMVVLVTAYHKGYSHSKKAKVIHRFVPAEVGHLIVLYLWLVEPFVRKMLCDDRGQRAYSPYIWEPRPEKTVAEALRGDSDDSDSNSDEDGDDDVGPSGGSQPKAKSFNPDGFWDTGRLTRILMRESKSRIDVALSTSTWRHVYPAIHRRISTDRECQEVLSDLYGESEDLREAEGGSNEARALQSGHVARTEDQIYGLTLSEHPLFTQSDQQRFRAVSIEWHCFLRFASTLEPGALDPVAMSQRVRRAMQIEAERWRQISQTNILRQLRVLMGDETADFRGIQREALQHIMRREPKVLVIMGTGVGKSLLFMLPASASPAGTTIVVVPLVALRDDMKKRCDGLGIRCEVWDGASWISSPQIVLVTTEAATTLKFSRYVDQLRAMRLLDRIAIDECHVILDSLPANHSGPSWRPAFLELVKMGTLGVQVVYLTATLPVSDEPALLSAYGIEPSQLRTLRAPTTRANLAYRVTTHAAWREQEALVHEVERIQAKFPGGWVLIYCRSVAQVEKGMRNLGWPGYHAKIGSDAMKREIVDDFASGRAKVLLATCALGMGVDLPSIRAVVHLGSPNRLKDYGQESGRAGRDGKPSECLILQRDRIGQDGELHTARNLHREPAMSDWLRSDQCKRVIIDRVMDGRLHRVECESGEERCDVCQASTEYHAGKVCEPPSSSNQNQHVADVMTHHSSLHPGRCHPTRVPRTV